MYPSSSHPRALHSPTARAAPASCGVYVFEGLSTPPGSGRCTVGLDMGFPPGQTSDFYLSICRRSFPALFFRLVPLKIQIRGKQLGRRVGKEMKQRENQGTLMTFQAGACQDAPKEHALLLAQHLQQFY